MKEKEYKIPGGDNVTVIPADPEQQKIAAEERNRPLQDSMESLNRKIRARELRAQIQEQEIIIQFSKDRISALEDELREIEND